MQTQLKQIVSLLGLAQRAGKLVSGEDTVSREISKKIFLLIVAADCSANTRNKAEKWAHHYQIPIRFLLSRDKLGQAIGKEWRAIIGIKDKGFSNKIQCLIDQALAKG